jgi:hypothetical protein
MIGSLSHLIRAAAISAILDGTAPFPQLSGMLIARYREPQPSQT